MQLSHQTPDIDGCSTKKTGQQISLLARAIRYLSNREHSREELIRKLSPHAQSAEELEDLLKKLEEKGLQSNDRFAENLVRRRSERYGIRRVAEELRQNKIDPQKANELIVEMKISELDRAKQLWDKKFGELVTDPKELGRQARFLASKGFDAEVVGKVIRGKI